MGRAGARLERANEAVGDSDQAEEGVPPGLAGSSSPLTSSLRPYTSQARSGRSISQSVRSSQLSLLVMFAEV